MAWEWVQTPYIMKVKSFLKKVGLKTPGFDFMAMKSGPLGLGTLFLGAKAPLQIAHVTHRVSESLSLQKVWKQQ